jgi:hypothetical protein
MQSLRAYLNSVDTKCRFHQTRSGAPAAGPSNWKS